MRMTGWIRRMAHARMTGILLFSLLSVFIILSLWFDDQLNQSQKERYLSYMAADELRQSSDDLTRMARTYVVTNDPRYETMYGDILAIRNGEAARPLRYESVYWDFVASTSEKPRPDGQAISLLKIMEDLGFTQEEFELLAEAQKYSDDLVKKEVAAMHAMKGEFPDAEGKFSMTAEPDVDLARSLLFGEAYHRDKVKIMAPIDAFFVAVNARTEAQVTRNMRLAYGSVLLALTMIVALLGLSRFELNEHKLTGDKLRTSAQALRKTEKLFRATFEQAAVGIAHVSPEGHFLRVNKKFCDIVGYSRDEMLKFTFQEITHPDDLDADIAQVQQLLAGDIDTYSMEKRYLRESGDITWIHLTVSLVRDDAKEPQWLVGVVKDINERKVAEENLRKSEDHFRGLMEQSPIAIEILAPDGRICQVNSAWLRLWGFNDEESAQTMESYNLLDDKQAEELGFAHLVRKSFEGEAVVLPPFQYVLNRTMDNIGLKHITGKSPWIRCHLYPIKNAQGKVLNVVVAILDITELKAAEDKLSKSEQRFRSLMEQSPLAIEILSPEGQISQVNPAWRRLWGINEEEAAQVLTKYNMLTDKQIEGLGVAPLVKKAFGGEAVVLPPIEYVVDKTMDDIGLDYIRGQSPWIQCHLYPVKSLDGKVLFVVNTYVDLTERKQAELQVREMASFAELNPAPVLRVNLDGIILSCNPASSKILGKKAQKGTSIASLLPDLSRLDLNSCIQGNMLLSQEVDIKGRSYLFILRGVADLKLLHIYGSDITQRKQSEEQLDQMRSELVHATRTGIMGEMTAALAHELNHPLGSILNNANAARRFLQQDNPDLDEIRDIIADIISEDRRASEVMQRVRNLMKKREVGFAPAKINSILEEVIKLTQSEFIIEDVSLSKQLAETLPEVIGERIQLQQVFINLIMNAIDAMKESKAKHLHISTAQHDAESIVVCVRDTGAGFDEQEKNSLFKPFFTTKEEGMGMGLSVTRTIVKSHGGDICAENNKDAGASFFVTLPVYKERSHG